MSHFASSVTFWVKLNLGFLFLQNSSTFNRNSLSKCECVFSHCRSPTPYARSYLFFLFVETLKTIDNVRAAVVGRTGVGKSTLINNLLGMNKAKTAQFGEQRGTLYSSFYERKQTTRDNKPLIFKIGDTPGTVNVSKVRLIQKFAAKLKQLARS